MKLSRHLGFTRPPRITHYSNYPLFNFPTRLTAVNQMDAASNIGLADFSEKDKKDMQQFLENERQKATFQENVHSLTAMCWNKCIAGKISGPQIDRSEGFCLDNCVNRYIDAQKTVIAQLEQFGNRS